MALHQSHISVAPLILLSFGLVVILGLVPRPKVHVTDPQMELVLKLDTDSIRYEIWLVPGQNNQPDHYYGEVFTPVCYSGTCYPVFIDFKWDLLGNYEKYQLPEGKVLTKSDHLQFDKKEKYSNHELAWVAYIGGKRESRRLLGDHILTQMDIQEGIMYPDGTVTATCTIDLHFPDAKNSLYFPGEEFFAATEHIRVQPYTIPYRCLYSRNIDNLFMAGRNISTTHVAFGSTRVMRTCGMMGEAVGYAAYVSKKNSSTPRGVYENHLKEFMTWIQSPLSNEILTLPPKN